MTSIRAVGALVVALVALAAPCLSAAASPAPGTLDRSFARHGALLADYGSEPWWGEVQQLSAGVDGGALVLTGWNAIARFLPDGSPDPSFGENGYLTGDAGQFRAMAPMPDGRIVTAGLQRRAGGDPYVVEVDRYLPDGAPDRSFAGDGSLLIPAAARFDYVEWVGVEPSGKIVLVSPFWSSAAEGVVALRLLPSGGIDRTYGRDGVARIPTQRGYDIYSGHALRRDCCVLRDGELTVATTHAARALLLRLRDDGSPDPSFGAGGEVIVHFASARVADIALTSDGRILLAGEEGRAVRLLPDGTPDPGFGSGGVAAPLPPELVRFHTLTSIAAQGDGKVLLGGSASPGESSQSFLVARLRADGSLDSAFAGGASFLIAGPGPANRAEGTALAVLPDGRILVGGKVEGAGLGPNSQLALARFLPDGAPDPSYGAGQLVIARPQGQANDVAADLLTQPDGRIVVAGRAAGKVLLARFLPGGRRDRSFGGDGSVLTRFGDDYFGEGADSVTRLADGRLLVGASSRSGGALLLYRSGGALDRRFGDGGIVRFPAFDRITDTAATRDGIILAAGLNGSGELRLFGFRRDGSVDRSFGGGDGVLQLGGRHGGRAQLAVRRDGRILVLQTDGRWHQVTPAGRTVQGFGKGQTRYLPLRARAIALDRRGRILVGGRRDDHLAVARFSPRGRFDRSFGRDGYATARAGRSSETTGLRLQPDGSVVLSGIAYPCSEFACQNSRPLVARFTPGGAPDRAFGRRGLWTARVGKTGTLFGLALGDRSILAAGYATRPGFSRDLLVVRLHR